MNCPNCAGQCITDKNGGWLCLKCNFSAPKNYMAINALMAFVACDENGNEGLIAMKSPQGAMPMVCADSRVMHQMRPAAQQIAERTGMKIKLLRFAVREELETIEKGKQE